MKKIGIIVFLLMASTAIFYIYEQNNFSRFIKKNHETPMNIPVNLNAPVHAKNEILIAVPKASVWSILTGIDQWPDWQKSVTEARLEGELFEGSTFKWKASGLSFHSAIHTIQKDQAFGWTGKTIGTYAIHNWQFLEQGDQTKVVVEESLQGILPRLFRKFFQKNLEQGIQSNLEELKIEAEKDSHRKKPLMI